MAEGLPARCWRRSPSIRREISEETGGEADIASLLQVLDSGAGTERQYFYLGRIASWDFAARTGPEFSQPGRGTYQPEQIPLTTAGPAATDLKPAAVAGLLRDAVTEDRDLFTLPDLRSAPSRNYRAGADLRRWVTGWYDDLARRLAAELAGEFPDDL